MNSTQYSWGVRNNIHHVRSKAPLDNPNQYDSGYLVVVAAGEGQPQ